MARKPSTTPPVAKTPRRPRTTKTAPPPPPTGGRPTGLTPEKARIILDQLGIGAFRNEAATAAGVPKRTFQDWMARGEKSLDAVEAYDLDPAAWPGPAPVPDEPFHSFAAQVHEIEAKAQLILLGLMQRMAQKADGRDAFKATRWMLETRWPKQYGRRLAVEHSGDPDRPIVPLAGSGSPGLSEHDREAMAAQVVAELAKLGLVDPALAAAVTA